MQLFKNKKRAFTLLEMLIVLGIIAVIIAVATVSYSAAQKKSRDARRKTDLKTIQSSLEQYYSICGFNYPTLTVGSPILPVSCSGTVLLPTIPYDPKGADYSVAQSDSSSFQICATLETETPASYCLSNQQ